MSVPAHTEQAPNHRADQYDDPSYNYLDYWLDRDYEHQAEVMAIKRLLKGRHFDEAVDIGGGYGRLSVLLKQFATNVTLVEPSQQQLDLAKTFLRDHGSIKRCLMSANDIQLKDNSVDLVLFVRVMHHLPDPKRELDEIDRILKPGGLAIIEVANYMHAQNRLKHLIKGQKFPAGPVDIRSPEHRTSQEIPFVNHNPHTVIRQFKAAGLTVERALSVSNLRNPLVKKIVPIKLLLLAEEPLQPVLAPLFFGPSIFFLVRKA
jgi:ubiquinone/menaquinone biosynthesis C-methylase UbiE